MLTISIDIGFDTIKYYNKVLKWIKDHQQEHQVKLSLKVRIYVHSFSNKEVTEFLNSNKIIELEIFDDSEEILLSDFYYKSLRCLKLKDIE